jgi:hypothetical protein
VGPIKQLPFLGICGNSDAELRNGVDPCAVPTLSATTTGSQRTKPEQQQQTSCG